MLISMSDSSHTNAVSDSRALYRLWFGDLIVCGQSAAVIPAAIALLEGQYERASHELSWQSPLTSSG